MANEKGKHMLKSYAKQDWCQVNDYDDVNIN